MSATSPPSDLKRRVLEAARHVPSPTRREAALQTAVSALVSAAVGLGILAALGGIERVPGPLAFRVGGSLGWVLAALGATWCTFARQRDRRMLGQSRARLAAVTVGVPLLALGWMVLWGLGSTVVWPERVEWACLGVSLSIAALPLFTLLDARQHANPAHPVMAGAALGATAGAWSGVLVTLWCPVPSAVHVLVGHVAPVVLLSALGAALARRVVGMRAWVAHKGGG